MLFHLRGSLGFTLDSLAGWREQAAEERRRENEAETMYAEEAEKMWEKQEEVWRREAAARKRLMQEVVAGWKQQSEERLATAQVRLNAVAEC